MKINYESERLFLVDDDQLSLFEICLIDNKSGNKKRITDFNIMKKGKDEIGKFVLYDVLIESIKYKIQFKIYEKILCLFIESNKLGCSIVLKENTNDMKYMATYRHKTWWTRPKFTDLISEIPNKTESIFIKKHNYFIQFLAVCDKYSKSELEGKENTIRLNIDIDKNIKEDTQNLVLSVGLDKNPYSLAERIVKVSAKNLNSPILVRDEKKFPEIFEYFGWCSWDAFYKKVNQEGILKKALEFNDKKIPVKWLIVDDGWLDTNDRLLNSFMEDEEKFPSGFKKVFSMLKGKYDIKWIGVWHTLFGYWDGLTDKFSKNMEISEYTYKSKKEEYIPNSDNKEAYHFWDKWYEYLKKQGVDFVKTDGQSATEIFFNSENDYSKRTHNTHMSLEAAVAVYFNGTVINCMGMAGENIWSRPISSVSRNSDDFVPQEKNSFIEHIYQNAYNSIFHGQLYYTDFDMFWTKHKDAKKHALLRAMSGGPIYISDPVGETNIEYISPLILSDGKILRCDKSLCLSKDCIVDDPGKSKKALKLWNEKNDVKYVSMFNVNENKDIAKGHLKLKEVNSNSEKEYLIYDWFNKRASINKADDKIDYKLNYEDVLLYFVKEKDNWCIPIGLIEKYISSGTINNICSNENYVSIDLIEGGKFGFYSNSKPKKITVENKNISIENLNEKDGLYFVDINICKKNIKVEIYK